MISTRRNGIAKLVQAIGNVAASDAQLSRAAKLPDGTPVYAIHLATGHTLLFAAKDDRMVILSEPGMLLGEDKAPIPERAKIVARMLDGGDAFLDSYGLDRVPLAANGHRLVVSADYLSFGYQAFFTGIDALRFDFAPGVNGGESTWSTSALVVPEHLPQGWNSADLWHALPADPAACASLPVDWNDATQLLDRLGDAGKEVAPILSKALAGPAEGPALEWANDKTSASGTVTPAGVDEAAAPRKCRKLRIANAYKFTKDEGIYTFCQGTTGKWTLKP